MYVLHSFSTAAVAALGREQFLAVYLSSGVISSFASHVYKTMFGIPGLSLGAVNNFLSKMWEEHEILKFTIVIIDFPSLQIV